MALATRNQTVFNMRISDSEIYPIDTVVRWKRTGEFGLIKSYTFQLEQKGVMNYLVLGRKRRLILLVPRWRWSWMFANCTWKKRKLCIKKQQIQTLNFFFPFINLRKQNKILMSYKRYKLVFTVPAIAATCSFILGLAFILRYNFTSHDGGRFYSRYECDSPCNKCYRVAFPDSDHLHFL